jgi:Ca2+/H+ antiporter
MHQLGDIYIQLAHVCMVGAVHPIPNRHGVVGFNILFTGSHTHTQMFANPKEAQAAHAALIQALALVAK